MERRRPKNTQNTELGICDFTLNVLQNRCFRDLSTTPTNSQKTASGAGAESRTVIGMVIFAGVTVSVFLTLYIVPTAYYLLARNTGSPNAQAKQIEDLEINMPYRKGDEH